MRKENMEIMDEIIEREIDSRMIENNLEYLIKFMEFRRNDIEFHMIDMMRSEREEYMDELRLLGRLISIYESELREIEEMESIKKLI